MWDEAVVDITEVPLGTEVEATKEKVPLGSGLMVNLMMIQLNNAYSSLPPRDARTRQDFVDAYDRLCKQSMWKTKATQKRFPVTRFVQLQDVRFPSTNNLKVSEDRQQWKCSVCNDSGQDLRRSKFHMQNCLHHFLSRKHCDVVQKGDALTIAVDQSKQVLVTSELPNAIVDDTIITAARKSIPFSSIPTMLNVTARALKACRGEKPIPTKVIMDVRTKVSREAAAALNRLNVVVKEVNTSSGSRAACRLGRHQVAKRMMKLAKLSLEQKTRFLKTCTYLSLTCDESDTFSFTAPLAAALQGCDQDFLWGNVFIGQTDVATDKTGKGIYDALRKLLDGIDDELFDLIVWTCMDGASAMRSIPYYAGLDSKVDGDSLVAQLKKNGKPLLPNLHCLCHQLNLALKLAIKKNAFWSDMWLDHIKCIFAWFSKSPKRKASLKHLHKEMEMLRDVVTWRMVYPKYYCPTRWLGILRALKAILTSSELLEAYVDQLMTEGFRPDRGEPDDPPIEAAEARVDMPDLEKPRLHDKDFHQWREVADVYDADAWDLMFHTPGDDDMVVETEENRLSLEVGRARVWKDMPSGTNKKNKSKLLSERIGLTAQMLGVDAIMADALAPYKRLVERLQTQTIPIAHNARPWISEFFRELDSTFLQDDSTFGDNFYQWSQRADVSDEMCEQIKRMGRGFVFDFLKNVKFRFQPYWRVLLAAETINPCAPHRLSRSAWIGVKDLCKRVGMSDDKTRRVIKDLKKQHGEAGEWNVAKVKNCTNNLLRFYHDRRAFEIKKDPTKSLHPYAEEFARLVFSLHVSSSVVESFFSKTKYTKSIHRNRLRDELSSATLHLQQLRAYYDAETLEPASRLNIDFQQALKRVENNLDDLREKYMNVEIQKHFQDDEDNIRLFKGHVDDVYFNRSEGCFLFHINYDSDSDSEEMELWELKKYSV